MQPSGEPVFGCLEAQSRVELSDTPIQSEGVDPLPMEVLSHSFDDGDTLQFPPLVFSTEAGSSRGPFSPSLGAPSVASEEAPGATCQAGPTRAVLECFAGQAQLASALIKQGYFSYGVDRIKHKSAMAPVLQMDLSSRTACDLILTWLDQQKVAGVMICVPKHELEQLVEFEWRHWGAPALGRALAISNMPEITTVRREASPPTPRVALPSTALAGYPVAFATALAEVFISGLTARQLPCLNPARINKAARVAAMQQPRHALAEVVPEWKLVVYVLLPTSTVTDPFAGAKRLQQAWPVPAGVRVLPGLTVLPVDSQLLSRTQTGGNLSPQLQQEMQRLNGSSVLRVGIPWDPIEFIGKAGKLGHPFHQLSKINKPLEDLIDLLVQKPTAVRSRRRTFIDRWARRAKELAPEEAKLKAGMSEHRQKILAPKRIRLFKEMLEDIQYDDLGVVQELIDGATLTGDIPVTGVLDTKLKPARIDIEQLMDVAEQVKQQIKCRTVSSGDEEMDSLLWEKTLEEVKRGHLEGPFEFDSIPKNCLASSRFPLMQGGKLRPIDNYSSSLINDTVTVSEKPVTHSIDEIALLITKLSKSARKKGVKELFGKTADLQSAYRQLAISDESLKYSYLAVFDPVDKKPKAFRQLAVPFGSTKAVYFFLRVARALWTILVKGALIPTTNYFDDFVLLALSGDRSSCSHAFDEVMNLLGWKLSEDKSTDWSASFEALSVLFEIDQTGSGVLKVRNTEKRREELTSLIQGFLASGVMTQKEALQLRGRLQFAQAQFFGRLGRRCLNEITRHAYSGRLKLSTSAKEPLEEFGKFLSSAQPRLVGQVSCRTFMILTDAAFEKETRTGGLGGVLLTGSGSALSYFSVPISDQQADALTAQEEQTIIYELEMFGVLVGLKLLVEKTTAFAEAYSQAGATAGTGVTCYIDNDAARHAFISGTAKKGVAGILIDEVNFLEYVHGILPWYARVASPANLADEPSRMKLDLVRKLGFKDETVEATKIVLSIIGRASTLAGDTATHFSGG